MYEALLDANPRHRGLMLVTGSLFIMYANAFVQGPAEMLRPEEWQARDEGMMRAKQLYLRGSDILYNALETRYRGFRKAALEDNFQRFLARCKKDDVGFLYWAAVGGLSAYSIDVLDFELSARIPEWTLMLQRAYELNPNYGVAALDELLFLFYASLPELMGGDREKAEFHFQQALEKTGGNSAGIFVSHAQVISIPAQDYETYKEFLEKALSIDPDIDISNRLITIITQQKAQWLLDNAHNYFSFLPFPDDY
jgi:predicted anti-sigma-YlaC factor YlaD